MNLEKYRLSSTDINRYSRAAGSEPNIYWEVTNPNNMISLSDATNYVYSNHPNDRFVYWPDYHVAGPVSDIVNIFRRLNFRQTTNDGVLFRLSIGRLGKRPMTMDLTEENVYLNSFDPTIEEHRQLIERVTGIPQIIPIKPVENTSFLESYETLLRRLYNLSDNEPNYLKVKFILFEQLNTIQIDRYIIDPLLQPWSGSPNTQNRILTIFDKNKMTYLVKARYDPVSNQIFPPL